MKYSLYPGSLYVGKDYMRNMMRLITDVTDDGRLRYSTYHIDGRPANGLFSVCDGRTFQRWIGREATDEETRRLQPGVSKLDQEFQDDMRRHIEDYLHKALSDPRSVTDEMLLAEVERRGLALPKGRR